jgi:hypothetical protein
MSSITLLGDTSGSIVIDAPAIAGNGTLTLPTGTATLAINGPAFAAYATSNQSIPAVTNTKVILNAEEFDTANCFDSTTNYRFTPNVAGYYQINGCAVGTNTSYTAFQVLIFKNGAIYKNGNNLNGNNSYPVSTVSSIVYFNGTTDYVELYAAQSATAVISGGIGNIWFNGAMVRSA